MKIRENGDYLMEIKQKGKNGKEKKFLCMMGNEKNDDKEFLKCLLSMYLEKVRFTRALFQ